MGTTGVSSAPAPAGVFPLSAATALLAAGAALIGLAFPEALYPTETLRGAFVANDVVTLAIGVPALLGSMALARRGQLTGRLFWPGALLFVTYNAIAYAAAFLAAMPPVWQTALFIGLAGLSGWAVFGMVRGLDGEAARQALEGRIPHRLTGGVLVGLGLLFFLRAVGQLASGAGALSAPELGTQVADLLTTPLWVAGGVLLWQRRGLGYLSGVGLLFQASMLFIGLLVYFLLQPLLSGAPFAAVDFAVVAAMGLVCFVPFGLYVRGIVRKAG